MKKLFGRRITALILAVLMLAGLTSGVYAANESAYEKFLKVYEIYMEQGMFSGEDGEAVLLSLIETLIGDDEETLHYLANELLLGRDKYGEYMTPELYAAFMKPNEYSGIGVAAVDENGSLTVGDLMPYGPAYRAGILVGDVLKSVDGADVTNLTTGVVTWLLRGEEGTDVTVVFHRPSTGEDTEYVLTRELLDMVEVEGEIVETRDEYYGIATIPDFMGIYRHFELMTVLEWFEDEGITDIVIDLRDNPGGELMTMLNMVNYLVPTEGADLISIYDKSGEVVEKWEATYNAFSFENIVILVNGGTASAAEMFAIILQDHGLATIVGEATYGKGVGQTMFLFDDGSSFKFTTIEIESPNGTKYDGVGVIPDVKVTNPVAVAVQPEWIPLNYENFHEAVMGAENSTVMALEQRLEFVGFIREADGIFDESTGIALRYFQSVLGATETAALDADTLVALTELVNSAKSWTYQQSDDQLAKAAEILKGAA